MVAAFILLDLCGALKKNKKKNKKKTEEKPGLESLLFSDFMPMR